MRWWVRFQGSRKRASTWRRLSLVPRTPTEARCRQSSGQLTYSAPVSVSARAANSRAKPEYFQGVSIPHSTLSGVDISSIGKYPYKFVHLVRTLGGQCGELAIDSVHVYSSLPQLGPGASMCYSMMHKYDDRDAERLFTEFMASVEQIGQVAASETMMNVAERVRKLLR